MVNLLSAGAGDPLPRERFSDLPGKGRQGLDVVEINPLPVLADKKEPVASPGNVPCDRTIARHINGDIGGQPATRNIAYADLSFVVKESLDLSDRRFDEVAAGSDAA